MAMIANYFGFDRSTRGDMPLLSVTLDERRILIYGPVIHRTKDNDELWRLRLTDQAKRLQDGDRCDLIKTRDDNHFTVYQCPATI